MSDQMLGYVVVLGIFGAFLWISWETRTARADDFYLAGRRTLPFWNGMAAGADWMSAASFLSMAGAVFASGYDGLAYVMGWTGGYVLLALVIAPYLRKFGKYTAPDFVGDRFESRAARVTAIVCAIVISFVYCIGQVAGCGIVMGRLLGMPMNAAIFVGVAFVVIATILGGMRSITWTQCGQYLVLIVAFLLPVTVLCLRWYGHPLPQIAYGDLLEKIVAKEATLGVRPAYIDPFGQRSVWDMWVLTFVLMVGTAGLPHILMRFFTTPTVSEARKSAGWALLMIGVLYATVPAYAAFSKYLILQDVIGKPVAELPSWVGAWGRVGLCHINDALWAGGNGDGIVQLGELDLHRDMLVLSMPEIAQMPYIVAALVAAGGLAASISTAEGLLTVMATAISHDLFYRMVSPHAPERLRMLMGKSLIVIFALLAGLVAAQQVGYIVQIVAWAFSLAAATFFPVIVTGIFDKRTNKHGAIVGMIGGLVITLLYILLVGFGWPFRVPPILGISDQGAGFFGMIFCFASCFAVSRFTEPPSQRVQDMVDHLRFPKHIAGHRF